ncbi:component of SufBCD complex [Roseisalinus antarcticus]|uniref:component of SufBCD complex n=1 Tax=Roseisalinus antarcticus TaxID=254357 RepID=UPI000A2687BF|nr:component of SufBCD complex [Roseisalinus antarcticus]
MNWTETVFEVIDMRSFSNLWFWIALAVVWSTASHWVLGVPFDMVTRARRHGGQAQADLEEMVRINVSRILYIGRVSGLVLLGFLCFVLTSLAVLGFAYNVEFAQALFLLGLPMSFVGALSLSTARLIETERPEAEVLNKRLTRHRQYVQVIGMLSIFVTALWGMWQNLDRSFLFNGF